MIEVKGITKHYGSLKAVDDVSFNVAKGEILGFIGPNGAGKSTTIKLLMNYIFADGGNASILGKDVEKKSHIIKKDLGYVSSEVNFYSELTVEEIIFMSMKFHEVEDMEYYHELMTKFMLDSHKKMKELSLGNKKKVALVSALVIRPKVLIMDEPTNGLDPLIQKVLFSILKDLAKDGVAILISSHNMKEIQDYCDRVMFIKKGKLIETISLKDVKLYGKYVKVKGDVNSLRTVSSTILSETKDSISFIYTEDINDLLEILSKLSITDLVVEDVSMEHQFLEYYQDEVSL